TRLGNGLPNVAAKDLQFSQDYEELLVGTVGRGAFMLSTQFDGPRVIAAAPTTPTSPGLSAVTVTFDHPVDPRTFTPGNIQSLTGPIGLIAVVAVKDIDPANHQVFEIDFGSQVVDGVYSVTIAPTVQDFIGNPMDQNGNTINGENPGDSFS